MRTIVYITVESFKLGQRDRREPHTGEMAVSVLDDERVLIGSEDNGVAFDLKELQEAIGILEREEARHG